MLSASSAHNRLPLSRLFAFVLVAVFIGVMIRFTQKVLLDDKARSNNLEQLGLRCGRQQIEPAAGSGPAGSSSPQGFILLLLPSELDHSSKDPSAKRAGVVGVVPFGYCYTYPRGRHSHVTGSIPSVESSSGLKRRDHLTVSLTEEPGWIVPRSEP
jgi:hypothetical protein